MATRNDILFVSGATTVTLEVPDFPYSPGEGSGVFISVTAGGRVVQVDTGQAVQQPVIGWNALPDDQYEDLRDFIKNTVNYAEHSFDFTDWRDDTNEVKYLSGLDAAEYVDADGLIGWAVRLTLIRV